MARDEPSTRPLLDKLGIRAGSCVSVAGTFDHEFWATLKTRTQVAGARPRKESDVILLKADSRAELARIAALRRFLKPNGGIWVIYPKGQKHITEANVIEAGLSAGLVDNKVVRFSETCTGLRFVIPLAQRRAAAP